MQQYDAIKLGIEYIENNLKTEITAEDLAKMDGYSVWHYQKVFSRITGMSIAAYIGKRRLDKALGEITYGRCAVDVAFDYGFDTYAGFYKAFVKMYGESPKKYLNKTEVLVMFTKKELRDVLSNWDIPQDLPIIDIHIMDGSKISNNVWSVGEDYILKIGEQEKILRNLNVAKALTSQGFTAMTPISTKYGTEYVDGEKIIVLVKGIKGKPLSKANRFGDNRRKFGFEYGEKIALLHKALDVIEPDIKPQKQNLYKLVMEWALPELKKQNYQYRMKLSESFFEDYINNFELLFDKLPKQLIHRDPNPSNILFNGDEISGFMEFDLSEHNIRLFDPCYCATGILSEWRDVNNIQNK